MNHNNESDTFDSTKNSLVPFNLTAGKNLGLIIVITLNRREEPVLVTSFYYQEGMMKDHVKGAIKPWETFLLSWASLDFFVGTDKMYGSDDNPFYTSLKPWNRRKSDMNDFAQFLRFWGWGL